MPEDISALMRGIQRVMLQGGTVRVLLNMDGQFYAHGFCTAAAARDAYAENHKPREDVIEFIERWIGEPIAYGKGATIEQALIALMDGCPVRRS